MSAYCPKCDGELKKIVKNFYKCKKCGQGWHTLDNIKEKKELKKMF